MRRAVLAITGLAASTTALVVLKGSPGASHVAQDLPGAQASVGPDGAAAPGLTPAPGASAKAPASTRPSARPSGGRAAGAQTRTTAKATAAPTKATTTRTVTGPVVSYRYGSLQVRITLSGGRIVDAVGLGMPQDGQSGVRSDDVQGRYSGTSGEVVARQSANLDTVSGATYTSTAYQQSLQAAIDKA